MTPQSDPRAPRETEQRYRSPGVRMETEFALPRRKAFRTGVPLFLGRTATQPGGWRIENPPALNLWEQFEQHFGAPVPGGYLAYAVRGFFENGGEQCYVIPVAGGGKDTTEEVLARTESLLAADLVCAPDLFAPALRVPGEELAGQQAMVRHCARTGGRFSILDTRPDAGWQEAWELWSAIDEPDGAIYYPWIRVRGFDGGMVAVPPCGHVAGVYARTDQARGVHKAPANEVVRGALQLQHAVTSAEQDFLNPKGINCLRAFAGRGIRVWGARTLAGHQTWRYVNVRRVFTTAVRWIRWHLWDVVFEPNDASLWAHIESELRRYFTEQYRRGALQGRNAREAFYVKCDAETNPRESRDAGRVVSEIGLATSVPFEFVVVRLIQEMGGVTISGPGEPR